MPLALKQGFNAAASIKPTVTTCWKTCSENNGDPKHMTGK